MEGPLGLVVKTIDQLPATSRSIIVRISVPDEPTAEQSPAHDTDRNTLLPGVRLRLGSIDHLVPFQRSTSVSVLCEPTATQLCAVVHETPSSWFGPPPFGVGDGTTDHDVPFHRSINVSERKPDRSPTAKQLVALVQVIDDKRDSRFNVGLATIAHVVPFQRSINTSRCPDGFVDSPTAKQSVGSYRPRRTTGRSRRPRDSDSIRLTTTCRSTARST